MHRGRRNEAKVARCDNFGAVKERSRVSVGGQGNETVLGRGRQHSGQTEGCHRLGIVGKSLCLRNSGEDGLTVSGGCGSRWAVTAENGLPGSANALNFVILDNASGGATGRGVVTGGGYVKVKTLERSRSGGKGRTSNNTRIGSASVRYSVNESGCAVDGSAKDLVSGCTAQVTGFLLQHIGTLG